MVARSFNLIVLMSVAVAGPAVARDTIAVQAGTTPKRSSQASGPSTRVTALVAPQASYDVAAPSRRFEASFDEGMAAIRDKNPVHAIELMQPFLANFERLYAGERRQMFCALTPQQSALFLADAARARREAVAVEPSWCRAQYVRGFALIDLGKLDDALVAFQNLTALAPRNSRYLNELGYVLLQQKKWSAAIDVFSRSAQAAELSPDDLIVEQCAAFGGMGSSMLKIGRLDEAEAAFRKCLALRPGDQTMLDALDAIAAERKQAV